jgi:hypothetical protein
MPLTVRELKAIDARMRHVQLQTDTIGRVLDACNQSVAAQLGQLASLSRVQLRTEAISKAMDACNQSVAAQLGQLASLSRVQLRTEAISKATPDPEWPDLEWLLPFGQIAVRALVLTVFLLLIGAIWEEKKDSSPTDAVADIVNLLAIWCALDLWIWKKLS